MSFYLNQDNYGFASDKRYPLYVDKSLLIKETNACFGIDQMKFMCVTRPRRFGKTMALKMLNAYYSKGCDSKSLFEDMKIADDPFFLSNLNKHNVLWIDMAGIYTDIDDKSNFIDEVKHELICALDEAYPGILSENENTLRKAIVKVTEKTGERFVFLIDEWDVIYREEDGNRKLCDGYTEFLRSLFKSSDASRCFDLVYMTGILPIRRYNTQSALNMFVEYNMLEPRGLAPHFGFTEGEVRSLCQEHGMDFPEIKSWYDGYKLGGLEVYNPKSVVEAMTLHKCGDYWVTTSATEAVANYMNFDGGFLKGTITRLLAGESVRVNAGAFGNDLSKVDSPDAALTVLIHLGYLGFVPSDELNGTGLCFIPNREISQEFARAAQELDWNEVYSPLLKSKELYERTLLGDCAFINSTLDENHKDLASHFNKNDENLLSLIVQISYTYAKRLHPVDKEALSCRGRADIVLRPGRNDSFPWIIELKVDKSPEEAISQIKERGYSECLHGYKGKVLLLGINYSTKEGKHSSMVEWIEI